MISCFNLFFGECAGIEGYVSCWFNIVKKNNTTKAGRVFFFLSVQPRPSTPEMYKVLE